jgi:hypothetical protein
MDPTRDPQEAYALVSAKKRCPGKIQDIGHDQGHVQDMSRTCETKVAVGQVTTIPRLCTTIARFLVLVSSHAMDLFKKPMPGDTSKYFVRR